MAPEARETTNAADGNLPAPTHWPAAPIVVSSNPVRTPKAPNVESQSAPFYQRGRRKISHRTPLSSRSGNVLALLPGRLLVHSAAEHAAQGLATSLNRRGAWRTAEAHWERPGVHRANQRGLFTTVSTCLCWRVLPKPAHALTMQPVAGGKRERQETPPEGWDGSWRVPSDGNDALWDPVRYQGG
jgi:hypothetical protein